MPDFPEENSIEPISQVTVNLSSVHGKLEAIIARGVDPALCILGVLLVTDWLTEIGYITNKQLPSLVKEVLNTFVGTSIFLFLWVMILRSSMRRQVKSRLSHTLKNRVTWIGHWLSPSQSITPQCKEPFKTIEVPYFFVVNGMSPLGQFALLFAVVMGVAFLCEIAKFTVSSALLFMLIAFIVSGWIIRTLFPARIRITPGTLEMCIKNIITKKEHILKHISLKDAIVSVWGMPPGAMEFHWKEENHDRYMKIHNVSIELGYYTILAAVG